MRDNTQKPNLNQRPAVQVFAIMPNTNDYTSMGWGYLEIATDIYQLQSQHYIEVSIPDQTQVFLRSRMQLSNEYQRQKNTLILWNDPEQREGNNIAISFQDQTACQNVWKDICAKIGKSNLQIMGNQKLQLPSEKRIKNFVDKIKTSHTLVVYHLYKSQQFINAFWDLIDKLKEKSIQNFTAMGIIRELFSQYDLRLFQALMLSQNFKRLLSVFEFQTKIKFSENCPQKIEIYQLFQLHEKARRKLQVIERAQYLYDYVINHQNQIILQKAIQRAISDLKMQVLSLMLKQNLMMRLVQIYQTAKKQGSQQRNEITRKILNFFSQCILLFRKSRAFNAKIVFLQYYYKHGVFKMFGQFLSHGDCRAFQMISYFSTIDPKKCLQQFQQDYKINSGTSILRSIIKNYCQNPNKQFVEQTINFVRNFIPLMIKDKSKFQFFNKTIFVSIFMICKKPERILPLIQFLITQLSLSYQIQQTKQNQNSEISQYQKEKLTNGVKLLVSYLNKSNYFSNLADLFEKDKLKKINKIQAIKTLKMLIELNKNKKQTIQHVTEINNILISSGILKKVFEQLIAKSNVRSQNLYSSSLLNIVKTISQLKYNQLVQFTQNFNFDKDLEQIQENKMQAEIQNLERNNMQYNTHFNKQVALEIQNQGKDKVCNKNHNQIDNKQGQQLIQPKMQRKKTSQVQKSKVLLKKYLQRIKKIQSQIKQINTQSKQQNVNLKPNLVKNYNNSERRIYDYYETQGKKIHQAILEQEEQQKYLQEQIQFDQPNKTNKSMDIQEPNKLIKAKAQQSIQNDILKKQLIEKQKQKNNKVMRSRSRSKSNERRRKREQQNENCQSKQRSSSKQRQRSRDKNRQTTKQKQQYLLERQQKEKQRLNQIQMQKMKANISQLMKIKQQIVKNFEEQKIISESIGKKKETKQKKQQNNHTTNQQNYDVFENL